MDSADDIVARADRQWREMGVVARDRAALVADLRMELEGAAADGVPPSRLVGGDIRAFAAELAEASGARRVPARNRELLLTALAGAAPGLVLAWLLLWNWYLVVPFDPDRESPAFFVILYAVCAGAVLGGALYATYRRFADDPAVGRTVAAMAAAIPVAGGLAVAPTMGLAAALGYSTALPVLVLEAAVMAGAVAVAIVLARRWALSPALVRVG